MVNGNPIFSNFELKSAIKPTKWEYANLNEELDKKPDSERYPSLKYKIGELHLPGFIARALKIMNIGDVYLVTMKAELMDLVDPHFPDEIFKSGIAKPGDSLSAYIKLNSIEEVILIK